MTILNDDYYQEVADKFTFIVKKGLLYTENDVWAIAEDGNAQIGVTDFLQRLSGDVVFVELPKEGRTVRRGEEISSFETIKAVVSIASPFDGVIIYANSKLVEKPELVNEDPYGEGWFVIIAASNIELDTQQLMTADQYFELMKSKIKNN
jgi:glycine cleavage system H protein